MKNIDRNKNINRGFRKLEIWQEAVKLFKMVKLKLDTINNISLKSKAQIEDSILAVSSNIAEGYSRRSIKENIQFNNIALASLAENYSQIFNLYNCEIIEAEWFDVYDNEHYALENKMINFNKSQIRMLKNSDDWRNDYILKEVVQKYELS